MMEEALEDDLDACPIGVAVAPYSAVLSAIKKVYQFAPEALYVAPDRAATMGS